MNKIISIGVYLLMGWLIGAMLSSSVSLDMANSAVNFWFWAWLIAWPLLTVVKFIWWAMIVFVIGTIIFYIIDRW